MSLGGKQGEIGAHTTCTSRDGPLTASSGDGAKDLVSLAFRQIWVLEGRSLGSWASVGWKGVVMVVLLIMHNH
jgi:hypothetical protein